MRHMLIAMTVALFALGLLRTDISFCDISVTGDAQGAAQADGAAGDGAAGEGDTRAEPPLTIRGFLQTRTSLRPARSGAYASQLLTAEQRAQVELSRQSSRWDANAKLDFVYDPVLRHSAVEVREGYLSHLGENLDLRAGKQIITWGVGDLVFLTDVFPKDWAGFITGAPVEYLKKGSTALRADYEVPELGGDASDAPVVEAIFIPEFQEDRLPAGTRLSFFNPFPQAARQVKIRSRRSEVGLRLSRTIAGFSSALYLFSGVDPTPIPGFDPDSGTATTRFGRLRLAGLSTQGNTRLGLLSGEIAYNETEDTAGTDPMVNNPSVKALVGVEHPLRGNAMVGFQFLHDRMLHYGAYRQSLPAGFPSRDEGLNTLTFRWRDSLRNDTLRPTLFALYNLNDRDGFVKAEAQVEAFPGAWYIVGAHVFWGASHSTMFGQFADNANVYVTARYTY